MRAMLLASVILTATSLPGTATAIRTQLASNGFDGAWCQISEYGIPVNCSFKSFAQCRATVIGEGGGCQVNQFVAQRPAPTPRRNRH